MMIKIISGGQTGVDRAGLEAAKECGLETGGYAPCGYLTENGRDRSLREFGLIDSGSGYPVRTALNVYNSDITLWFGKGDTPGFIATKRKCAQYHKPLMDMTGSTAYQIRCAIGSYKIVNIAGNRESTSPGIYDEVKKLLIGTFTMVVNE
ncbi:MAG: putative molybdenum carrier protein [Candidatus Babeliales bacterium]|jgi:hypothetical protein